VVAGELYDGVCREVQVDVAKQLDGAGQPISGWDDDAAAACGRASPDGLAEGFGIKRMSIGDSAEIGDAEILVGEGGQDRGLCRERSMGDIPGDVVCGLLGG